MTGEMWMVLGAAIVGGFLSALSGWFVNWRRDVAQLKKYKDILKTAICDDLENSVGLYEKIEEDWEKTKIFWLSTAIELRESRAVFEKYKDQIILFDDEKLRKNIFSYYLKSSQIILALDSGQNRIMEINKDRERAYIYSKQYSLDLSDQDIIKKVDQEMALEIRDFQYWQDQMPKEIQKLSGIKSNAKSLLISLENSE